MVLTTSDYAKEYAIACMNPSEAASMILPSLKNASGYCIGMKGNGTVTTRSDTRKVVAAFDQMSFTNGALCVYVYEMDAAGDCKKVTTVNVDRSASNYLEFAAIASKITAKNVSSPNLVQGQAAVAVVDGPVPNIVTLSQTDLGAFSMESNDYETATQDGELGACLVDLKFGENRLKSSENFVNPGDKSTYLSDSSASLAEFPSLGGTIASGNNNVVLFNTALIAATNPVGKKNPVNFRTSSITVEYNVQGITAASNSDMVITVEVLDAAGVTLSSVAVTHVATTNSTEYEFEHEVRLTDFSGPAHNVKLTIAQKQVIQVVNLQSLLDL